jgi:hypothetical protein
MFRQDAKSIQVFSADHGLMPPNLLYNLKKARSQAISVLPVMFGSGRFFGKCKKIFD